MTSQDKKPSRWEYLVLQACSGNSANGRKWLVWQPVAEGIEVIASGLYRDALLVEMSALNTVGFLGWRLTGVSEEPGSEPSEPCDTIRFFYFERPVTE